jgi:hypothetical protein
MLKKIKNFLSKLTLLSKILLSIVLISLLFSLYYFFSCVRYVNENEALLNNTSDEIVTYTGFTLKSRSKYYILDLSDKQKVIQIEFQTFNLNIYKTTCIIVYNYNETYLKETKNIPNEILFNDLEFKNYILNKAINYNINDLITNNKKEFYSLIFDYLNPIINNFGYSIKNIWFTEPIVKI